jgi:predicted GNAT superfamily acetyltransferase
MAADGRVLHRRAGHQAGPAAVSAQPHAGGAAGLPECRHRAAPLKLRQREEALARGIELIEWTFDPLELKNAFFNLERLGAVVRRYAENQYGVTASPLHGGLPTDRCIAEWWIDSPRVRAVLAGETVARRVVERIAFPPISRGFAPRAWPRARNPEANGEKFQRAFERGLAVTGFERSETEGTYLLEPWP